MNLSFVLNLAGVTIEQYMGEMEYHIIFSQHYATHPSKESSPHIELVLRPDVTSFFYHIRKCFVRVSASLQEEETGFHPLVWFQIALIFLLFFCLSPDVFTFLNPISTLRKHASARLHGKCARMAQGRIPTGSVQQLLLLSLHSILCCLHLFLLAR